MAAATRPLHLPVWSWGQQAESMQLYFQTLEAQPAAIRCRTRSSTLLMPVLLLLMMMLMRSLMAWAGSQAQQLVGVPASLLQIRLLLMLQVVLMVVEAR